MCSAYTTGHMTGVSTPSLSHSVFSCFHSYVLLPQEDLEKFNQTLNDNRNRRDLLEAEVRVIASDMDDLEKKVRQLNSS